MKTTLKSTDNCVNLLTIQGVTRRDMEDVAAWMGACGLTEKETDDGCARLLSDGEYSFSSLESRVSVFFST